MRRGNRVALAMVAALGIAASPALAWGPQGHRVITRIAMGRLTPEAKAGIKALLNEGDTLIDVCNWADHEGFDVVPRSGPWHYVNVPISAARYEARFCPERGCVVSKIKDYRKALADPKTPFKERQVALLFFVHFVEDIHQPLHVGDNGDRGGNDTQVQFDGRGTNLHRAWDSDILRHLGGDDRAWVDRATRLLTPKNVDAWSGAKVEDWADESLAAAKAAYRWPAGSKRPIGAGAELGDDYAKMADPILRERLAKAGLRLADELNAIFK
jgi:nuclease S1